MLNIQEIEASILRMTAAVRQGYAHEIARSFGEQPETWTGIRPLGWWVLVCGEPLDTESQERRDESRNRLLLDIHSAGVVVADNMWVWDETGTTQLVISTVPTLQRAEKLAQHLRRKGLTIRIKRED